MAGMFYSLQEVAQKLKISEEKVNELVKEGRLREFRDGANLLFKVDEVEAILAGSGVGMSPQPEAEQPELAEEPESDEPADEALEETTAASIEGLDEALDETTIDSTETIEDLEETIDELAPESEELDLEEDEILLSADEETPSSPDSTDELLLDTGFGSEADSDETAIAGEEGINVLGETDGGYKLADDTLGETRSGSGAGASLEEIEEDVNLDTFGSGSGLLDLSLQADDTSLGGILDEIYTPEGEGEEPAEPQAEESFGQIGEEEDAAAASAEMLAEEELAQQQPIAAAAVGSAIEAKPDNASNVLGLMLFLPIAAITYATVVVFAGASAFGGIQAMIWHIVGGLAAASIVMIIIAFMGGGDGSAKPKKVKVKKEKVKKPKKEKKKKEKKKKEK